MQVPPQVPVFRSDRLRAALDRVHFRWRMCSNLLVSVEQAGTVNIYASMGHHVSSSLSDMSDKMRGVQGAWRGGPCPQCGDVMPANLVHCATCRAMLNSELTENPIEVPEFIPLPEIMEMKTAVARGHYVRCGGCQEELRINAKYQGAAVQCRHCNHTFQYNSDVPKVAMYTTCPHCSEEIRANMSYVGQNVACRFCNGPLKLQ